MHPICSGCRSCKLLGKLAGVEGILQLCDSKALACQRGLSVTIGAQRLFPEVSTQKRNGPLMGGPLVDEFQQVQQAKRAVDEWLGVEGDKWRANPFNGGFVSEQFKAEWAAFRDAHRGCTLADVEEELKSLQRKFEQARDAGTIHPTSKRGRGKRALIERAAVPPRNSRLRATGA
jgi:hypothetical protein